ncbi:MAG: hypothetical protein WDO69_23085 [Pseudomonadota bacterium]
MASLTASVGPRCSPAELATLLGALEVRVTDLKVERRDVSLPDYPGGPRPSSVVHVSGPAASGQSATGRGEHVAFTDAEHEEFAATMPKWFGASGQRASAQRASGQRVRVDHAIGREVSLYGRAALEAALIDLGLRQAGLGLADLTGVRDVALRFVVSLATDREPLSAIARVRAEGFTGDLKIDVDPSWNDATLAALAADPSIRIFDFKGKGDLALAKRLAAQSAQALFEDPPSGFEDERGLVSRDSSLPDADAVCRARARGEAVNLKAPRMGGPLELLRGLEGALAPRAGIAPVIAYLGGMFEVSVGRTQARQLAALYCASGPNDLAPNLAGAEPRQNSPVLVRLDQPGFGGD